MVRSLMVCASAVLLLVCSDAALSKMVYESKTGFIHSIEAKVDVGWQYSHLKAQDDRTLLVTKNDQEVSELIPAPRLPKKNRRSERRRLKTKLQIKFNKGFTFYLQIEEGFKHVNPAYSNQRSYVDKLWGSWKHSNGHELLVGYARPSFGIEEQASFFGLKAIERSIASNYFNGVTSASSNLPNGFVGTPLGIGNKHLGVYGTWIQGQSTFRLGLAKETFNPFGPPKASKSRDLGFYGSWHGGGAGKPYKLGVNLAVLPDGVVYKPVAAQQFGRLMAVNPYFIWESGKTYMVAELFAASLTNAAVSSGANATTRSAADNARSIGLTLVFGRTVLTRLELVGRFSYLDSGSSGFSSGRFSDVVRGASFDRARPGNFDQAVSGYAGLNVRLTKSLGLKAGYERISAKKDLSYLQLNTNEGKRLHDDSKASVGVFRAQVWLKI